MNRPDTDARTEIWGEILQLWSEQVFCIGTVANIPQPIVVAAGFQNVPDKGIWSWEPGRISAHLPVRQFLGREPEGIEPRREPAAIGNRHLCFATSFSACWSWSRPCSSSACWSSSSSRRPRRLPGNHDGRDAGARREAWIQDKLEFLRKTYGLDEPMYVQYMIGCSAAGTEHSMKAAGCSSAISAIPSNTTCRSSEVVGDALMLTRRSSRGLDASSSWIVSFPIAVYSATHQYSIWSTMSSPSSAISALRRPASSSRWSLLYFANIWFGISIGGMMEPEYVGQPWSLAKVMSRPVSICGSRSLVIGLPGTAGMIRRLRANLLDELSKQYVVDRPGQGPAADEAAGEAIRCAISLNPFIADIGSLLPELISGSVMVSVVMSLPITGPMLLSALALAGHVSRRLVPDVHGRCSR